MPLPSPLLRARSLLAGIVPESRRPQARRLVHHRRRAGLWRRTPLSQVGGYDRGRPVDRVYIERFLDAHRGDIRGTVLEVGDRDYTERYGGAAVVTSDVLHARPGNPIATLVGDFATGDGIPAERYDCLIATDVLQTIFDVPAAVCGVHDALVVGGVALVTLPGLQPVYRSDADAWGDFWRFHEQTAVRLFEAVFGAADIEVRSHGNALTAAGAIYGLAEEDLRPRDFTEDDPLRPVTVTVRAVRRSATPARPPGR